MTQQAGEDDSPIQELSFPHQKRNIARTNFKARPSICYQTPPFLGKSLGPQTDTFGTESSDNRAKPIHGWGIASLQPTLVFLQHEGVVDGENATRENFKFDLQHKITRQLLSPASLSQSPLSSVRHVELSHWQELDDGSPMSA